MTRLASIPEVCVKFGISDATVRRLIKAGKLKAVKVGAQIRIPEQAIADMQAGR